MNLSFKEKIVYGALVMGLIFPIAAVIIATLSLNLPFSFDSIVHIHTIMPSNYLIDMAPIILPVVAFFVTKMVDARSAEINEKQQNEKFNKVEKFVDQLGQGNYDVRCELADNGDNIGIVLEDLKQKLSSAKTEEDKRRWDAEGMVKFGDLQRENSEDLNALAQQFIQELVKYVDARCGAFYMLDDSRKKHRLELISSYAYKPNDTSLTKIEVGEGLVGQCAKEKEIIHIDNVPEDFQMGIESGLGESAPKEILIVPLVTHERCVGVIEIATLLTFEEYQVEFVKNLSDTIAVSISNVKTSQNTKDLLEESQFMSQQLQAQEEELRQNAEELQATQEEIERKLAETEEILRSEREKIQAIVNTSSEGIIVFSPKGRVQEFNPAFQELFGYTKTDLRSMNVSKVFNVEGDVEVYLNDNLGNEQELEVRKKDESEIWIRFVINKIDVAGKVTYSAFITDITEARHNIAAMEESLVEFQNFMMEQSEIQGKIEGELEEAKRELEELKSK